MLGSLLEFDKAIELDPRQKACEFLNLGFQFSQNVQEFMGILYGNLVLDCVIEQEFMGISLLN